MTGTATVTRPEQIFLQARAGEPVFESDIIETTADGLVCIRFIDGTTFNLSNNARMALKEFPGKETARPALIDVARGDFAFIAGETAKAGRLEIDTPVARIRGSARVGGIGTLSLISLFFAAMEDVQAAPPDAARTEDEIIPVDYSGEPHGSFELTTKESVPRRIYVDDPGVTWALRLNSSSELSISSVANSPAQMAQLSAIQQSVLHTYSVGLQAIQGPTFNGQNGSTTNPSFEILPGNARPINFSSQPDAGGLQQNLNGSQQHSITDSKSSGSSGNSSSILGSDSNILDNNSTAVPDLFVPPPPPPPQPLPPPLPSAPTITTTAPAQNHASSIDISGTAAANSTVTLFNSTSAVGTTSADGSGSWQINNIALADGSDYNFTATATDSAGHTSGASNTLVIHDDQTAPSAPLIVTTAPSQNTAPSIDIAGTAEANSTVTLLHGASQIGMTTADASGDWHVNGIALVNGAQYSFTATATDAAGNSSGPSNALTFDEVQNHAPVILGVAGSVSVIEDVPTLLKAPVTATITDDDQDTLTMTVQVSHGVLTPTQAIIDAITNNTLTAIDIDGSDGKLVVSGSPDAVTAAIQAGVTYTPNLDSNLPDALTVTVDDGKAPTTSASVTIDITPVDDAPVTSPVTLTAIAEDSGPRLITQAELLANASDVDGPALTAVNLAISSGSGTLTNNNDGTWTYHPALNDDAAVTFSYAVSDGIAAPVATTASLDITPVNDAPTVANAIADQGATQGSPFTFQFAGNTFNDVDTGDTLNYAATLSNGSPLPSWLGFDAATRTFSGTPANGDVGSIAVKVTATDGGNASVSDIFNITVGNTNDAPVNTVPASALTVNEDVPLGFAGAISVHDVDGNLASTQLSVLSGALTVNLAGGATISSGANGSGTLTLSGSETQINAALATLTYQGGPNFNGDDTLTVLSTDSGALTDSDTVQIHVTPVDDAPVTSPVTLTAIAEDSGPRLITQAELLANASDVDGPALTAVNLAISSGSGTLTNNNDGTWTYHPALNDDAAVTFSYAVSDGIAAPVATTASLDITPVNDAPTVANAIADQGATQGSPFTFQFAGNTFNDVDTGDTLNYAATLSNGSPLPSWLGFDAATRTFSGTPANGDVGSIAVKVTATDGGNASVSDIFNITVGNTNDAPVNTVPASALTVNEDVPLGFAGAISVHDVDGNLASTQLSVLSGALTVNLAGGATISSGANGSGTLTLSGSETQINAALATLTYQGGPNFNGDDTLTVLSTDSGALTDSDTVQIHVTPVDDAPVTSPVTLTAIAEDSGPRLITQAELLANASDVDGPALTAVNLAISSGSGTLTNNNDGTWTYHPALNDDAAVTFSYAVSDGIAAPVATTASLDITPVNDAPTVANAIADQGATQGSPFTFQFAGNTFNDVDTGDTLNYAATLSNGSPLPSWLGFDAATRTFSGTPANGDVGSIAVKVTATDGGNASVSDIFNITVGNTNDAPVNTVPASALTVNEDVPLGFAGAISVHDVDGNLASTQLSVLSGALTVNLAGGATISSGANGSGTLTLSGSETQINAALATLTYQGGPNFNGDDTLTVLSTDSGALTDSDTVQIHVTPVDDAPVTSPVTLTAIAEDSGPRLITQAELLANASDVDGPALTAVNLAISSGSGTLTNNNDGTWTYHPALNDDAAVTFSYAVSDGIAAPVATTASLDITPVNDAPTVANAIADQGATQGSPFTFQFAGNTFNDVDTGDTLNYAATLSNGSPLPSWLGFDAATRTFSGTPANGDVGSIAVKVTATDGGNASVSDIFNITVGNTNDAPVNTVPASALTVNEDVPLGFAGAISVHDVDGNLASTQLSVLSGALTVNLAGGATISSGANGSGTLTLSGSETQINAALATLTYQGGPNFNGDDTLTVLSTDSGALTDSDTVQIHVTPVDDAPVTSPVTLTAIAEDSGPRLITQAELLANASDVDGPALTAVNLAISSGSGTLTNNNDGTWTYHPALNDDAAVTFSYAVSDGIAAPVATTASLDITPVNDAPTVANAIADQGATQGSPFTFQFAGNTFNDVDTGDTLNYAATLSNGSPLPSWLGFDAATRTFSGTPANGDVGSIAVKVTATDGGNASVSDIFNITVGNTNDAPVNTVPASALTVNEDVPLGFAGAISVHDVDGNLASTQLSVLSGALTVNLAGGATISSGANGSGTLTLSGSETQINAALATLTYQGGPNFNGDDTLTVLSTDSGALTDSDTVQIHVTPVDDAPVTSPVTLTAIAEDSGPRLITQAELLANASDVDGPALTAVNLAISSGSGTLTNNNDGTWTYHPALNDDAAVTFSYAVSDGIAAPVATTASLDITPVNDAPVASITPVSYSATEQVALSLKNTGLLISDADAGSGSVTVTLSVGEGTLTVGAGTSGASVSNNNSSSVTISGTVAQINALFNTNATSTVSYIDNSDAPASSTTLSLSVNDNGNTGSGGALASNTATATINIAAVNDAPVAANTHGPYSATEQTSLTLKNTGLLISDADAGSGSVTVTLSVGEGTLTVGTGTSGASVSNNNSSSVTISGTVAQINALLNTNATSTVSYVDNSDAPASSTTLSLSVNDNGNTGSGGALASNIATATINIAAVNDAPSGTDKTVSTLEDTAYTFTAADFGFSDTTDNPAANALLAVKITTLPGVGTLTDSGNVVSSGTSVSVADITGGLLKFTPVANANGSGYASFTFQVQDNGGVANGGIDTDPSANTITVNVNAVNDAPSGTDKTVTTSEDTAYTFTAADFGFSDVDGNALQAVKITTLPGAGSLTNNGSAVASGASVSVADINNGLLKFTPAANANGNGYASFTFQVQDNGGVANGGIDTDPSANTITVNVNAVNDAPETAAGSGSGNQNTTITVPLSGSDVDGTVASFKIASLPVNGTLYADAALTDTLLVGESVIATGNAAIVYFKPNVNYSGPDSFTYAAVDNNGAQDATPATASITVIPASTVTLTIATPNGYDMHGLYGDIANSDINVATATNSQFDAIDAGSGHTFHVVGTGLTYNSGDLTGGTIAEIDIKDTETGSTLLIMTGFAIDAVAMNSAINAFANSSDPSQLTAIFSQYSYVATGGSGNDNILSFANADSFDGGGGLNTVDYIHSGSGITANLANPSQNTGSAAGDTYTSDITALIGTNFADTLIGNTATNVLEGGSGGDTLFGNGGGLDFASYAHAPTFVTANLANPSLNTGDAAGDSYNGINGLIGSNFADILSGDGNDNFLRGRGGGDTLDGGAGNDTADYFNGQAVRADLSNPASNTGDAAGDTYISIENLRGSSFNDTLVGNAGNNRLDGGLGIDRTIYTAATGAINVDMAAGTVSGPGVGNDTLISIESVRGSAFDDIFVATGYVGASAVGSLPTTFNEFEGMGGNDAIIGNGNTVLSYLNATNGVTVDIAAGTAAATGPDASVGNDTFTGVQFIRGSAFADTLKGSNNGPGTVENFEGRGGNDTIDGRLGFDRAIYTFRTDSIATSGITVNLAAGTVGGDPVIGNDTLLSIESIRGTNFDDTYNAIGFTTTNVNGPNFGSAGFVVVGGIQEAFNDFEGLGGNDSITGNGNTRISYINANAGVTVDLSTGIAQGTDPGDLAGVGHDTIIGGVNSIIGSAFADNLSGSSNGVSSAEVFDGGAGNDTINGRDGFDQAVYNNDLGTAIGIQITVGPSNDKLMVSGDASIGTDTLTAVESVRGTNFADNFDATGFNGASPDIPNGTTFNEFEGMGGDDIITGNGNTRITYVSATAGVTIDLAAGTAVGNASVGTDTFTGVSRARGSNFNDTIFGDGNNNVLDGQGGNDLLGGRGGNDTLIGGANADTFFYSAGVDTVTDFDRSSGSFNHAEGDVINVVGSGVTSFAQLQPMMSQNGADTLINFGGGNTMTLSNVTLANLTQNDFVFSAPISGDLAITVNNGGSVVLTTADFHAIDPNAAAIGLTFSVSDPTNGHVAFASNPGAAISSFTEKDLEDGKVIFVHDGTNTVQASFKVSVFDGTTTSALTTVLATVPTAIINVLTANGYDFQANDPITLMGLGQIQPTATLTPPQITIINSAANLRFVFEGPNSANFVVDNNLNPTDITGGSITKIHVLTNDPTPVPLFDIVANVAAASWYDAVVAAAAGNQAPFDALTSGWALSFIGAAGVDAFGAGDTNDFFRGSGGSDRLDGGFGFDRVNYTSVDGAIDVVLKDGTVTKYADGTRTTVAGVDTLQSIELITGTNFKDIFNAVGFNATTANAGSTVTFNVDGTLNEFEGRGGDDTITGNGNTRISYLHATGPVTVTFQQWVTGVGASGIATGNDSVGTDIFTGVDRVRGSSFADVFNGSNNDPNTTEFFEGRGGDDIINGNGGFDRAIYSQEDSFITVHLGAGKVVGNSPNTGIDTLNSVESVIGTEFNDTYIAAADSDPVYGSVAFGAAGAANVGSNGTFNEFEGGGGADTIIGNFNTRIAYYNATDGVAVTLGANGAATSVARTVANLQPYLQVHAPNFDPADIGVDNIISGVTRVRGSSFGDVINGNGGDNILEGAAGDDTLGGATGNDTLIGGTGTDRFVYTSGGLTTITDFDQSGGSFDHNEADRIDLRNVGIANFTALQPMLSASGSDTVITIGAGTITIKGVSVGQLQERDFLFAGQVDITNMSPNGFDFGTLYDDFAGINPSLAAHDATHYIAVNPGAGLIFTFNPSGSGVFSYDVSGNPTSGNVGNIGIYDSSYDLLAVLHGYNFPLTNFLNAAASHDTNALDAIFFNNASVRYNAVGSSQVQDNDGHPGGDTFISSVNNDVFDGLSNANGDGSGGDTVDYSHTPGPTGVTVDLTIITGQQNTGGSGMDALFNIENLRGSAFNDTLTGDGSNNVLEGGPGNDTLNGNGGIDTVSYEHASAGVTVDLASGTAHGTAPGDVAKVGTDTVSNFEAVRGSAFNDTLTGSGTSLLEGGAGGDTLIGAIGGSDTASYEHATAAVTVNLLTPGANTGDAAGDTFVFVDNLSQVHSISNVRGSQFNDTLIGDNNANVLNGWGTRDNGGDTLTGNGGGDTFVFSGGRVTVTDFSHAQNDKVDLSFLNFGNGITDTELQGLITAAPDLHTLDFGNGQTLTIENVNVSSLQSSDFILHH